MRSFLKSKCCLPSAFTIVELMVVIVIVSLVAGFAIPNYTKAVEKAHRKDAENNLRVIHAAAEMYAARNNGAYWGPGNLAAINANLGINIIANGMTYACTGGGNTFTCTASRAGWVLEVTDASDVPACQSGPCP